MEESFVNFRYSLTQYYFRYLNELNVKITEDNKSP